MWTNLSKEEVDATRRAISSLTGVPWATALLKRSEEAKWWTPRNKPYMFEIRLAAELNGSGYSAEYEHPAGVGSKTIDFLAVRGESRCLVEIVSVNESAAVGAATDLIPLDVPQPSNLKFLQLSTAEGRRSEEGEYLRVQDSIREKVGKFPKPPNATIQIILVDIRGFCGVGCADKEDYEHIVYGARRMPAYYVRQWEGKPISGMFELANPLQEAALLRERIHFIAFANEENYEPGELRDPRAMCLLPNPFLVPEDELSNVTRSIPFRPVERSL